MRAHGDLMVALTGAEAPVTVEDRQVATRSPLAAGWGDAQDRYTRRRAAHVSLGSRRGRRPGGSGSRASDTLSGIGPPPLKAGDLLPWPAAAYVSCRRRRTGGASVAGPMVLHVCPGPRDDWLAATDALTAATWTVSSRSDRVGIRLEGRRCSATLRAKDRLPSEGVVRGAIQVPSGGEPVLFLADHPVTGDYLCGGGREDDVDAAAQAVPEVSPDRLGQARRTDGRKPASQPEWPFLVVALDQNVAEAAFCEMVPSGDCGPGPLKGEN